MKNYNSLNETAKQKLIQDIYVGEDQSFQYIAKEYNTYPNKILRDAKKFKIPIRDKSQAQKNALKNGSHRHPTKGRSRTQEEKDKIGLGVLHSWSKADQKTIDKKKKQSKKLWDKKTDQQKNEMLQKANYAVRESSKKGSKMEHFILNFLVNNSIKVDFHKEQFLVNTKLQIDLFLPTMNIAIEVDGPSHFESVWGEEVLQRNITYDAKKTGLIIGKGYKLIRVKQKKDFSKTRAKIVCDKLLQTIYNINDTVSKVIEIEDNNA
jgi:very-short-patch-repair endonuclease|tara:strand:+ start:15879 stop:16670 length:792 start_codon:yes stop_codon:yes gene_type:complete